MEVAFTVRTMRNLEGEEVNNCRADSSSGKSALRDFNREAIASIVRQLEVAVGVCGAVRGVSERDSDVKSAHGPISRVMLFDVYHL